MSSSSLGCRRVGLIPHSRKQLCLWEQELTSTVIFYGLRPIRVLSAMAVVGSRRALHSEDEPLSVSYLTEMLSFPHA